MAKITQKPKSKITKRDPKTGRIVKGGSTGGSNETNKTGKAGTPGKIDKKIKELLIAAFSFNLNKTAACAYAGISRKTLNAYLDKHPEFQDEIDKAKQKPYIAAVETVVKAARKDPVMALKYLERKHKDEFSTRRELTGADGTSLFDRYSDEELEAFITSRQD